MALVTTRQGGTIARVEAARILAVHVATVDEFIYRGVLTPARKDGTGQLSREQVEHLALTTRPVKRLVAGGYWVTRKDPPRCSVFPNGASNVAAVWYPPRRATRCAAGVRIRPCPLARN